MHREDIKATLRKQGSSFAQVARACKVNRSHVSEVAARNKYSARVERQIAADSKLSLWKLFPDRYAPPTAG